MRKSVISVLFTVGIFLTTADQISAQPAQTNQKSSKVVSFELAQLKSDIGTEKFPIVVRIPQQDKSAEDTEKETYERGEKREIDRSTALYTRATTYITLGMLLVALIQGLLFFWQLRMMKKTLIDSANSSQASMISAIATRESTEMMKKTILDNETVSQAAVISANAARESTDIAKKSMIASNRAYIQFASPRFISHPLHDTGRIFWRFRPKWMNCGNTPSRGLKVFVKFELLKEPMSVDFKFEFNTVTDLRTITLGPGDAIESGITTYFGDELQEVKNGTKYLYIWGVATYNSVFEESSDHITKFCVQATNVTGNPILPFDEKQPLGIDFAIYGAHNCTDEDCLL